MTAKETIKKVCDWVATDGLLHFLVCMAITIVAGLIFKPWIAIIIALVVGVAKEVYDCLRKKSHDHYHDLICDLCGAMVGLVICVFYIWLK